MFDLKDLFVTPHAIVQFQHRIAPLTDDKARCMILSGIQQATNIRVLPDGRSWRVRTQRPFPFEFRAFCVFDETRGHAVVTTVVRGDSRATRDRRYKGADMHQVQNNDQRSVTPSQEGEAFSGGES